MVIRFALLDGCDFERRIGIPRHILIRLRNRPCRVRGRSHQVQRIRTRLLGEHPRHRCAVSAQLSLEPDLGRRDCELHVPAGKRDRRNHRRVARIDVVEFALPSRASARPRLEYLHQDALAFANLQRALPGSRNLRRALRERRPAHASQQNRRRDDDPNTRIGQHRFAVLHVTIRKSCHSNTPLFRQMIRRCETGGMRRASHEQRRADGPGLKEQTHHGKGCPGSGSPSTGPCSWSGGSRF